MKSPSANAALRFGRFELQPQERRLLADGEAAAIGARALDILIMLAGRSGSLVSKRELMDEIWPGLVVEENNLAVHISALRKVLGDQAIATIPGRGYRFTLPVDLALQPAAPATVATAPAPSAMPRSNLPADLPPLLGREDDLQALTAMVAQQPLVTIIGAGGIGKTALAKQLLHAHRDRHPHGVCWVELGPVTDPGLLPGTLAAALGVELGVGAPVDALAAAVAPLDMLVALDNAEHLLDDVARLCRVLVAAAPRLHLLVTSQAPLKLATEQIYRLDTLAVPPGPMAASEALAYGAVALFVARARAADARFPLNDDQVAAVIELCRALDGLPLALELAAARAPMLGARRLVASMHERLKLLTRSRDRAAPARQQTLRAALEWSHGLLEPREQAVFRRIGVVAGSASLDLVQQLVTDDDLDAWASLDALGVLVDRSLVTVLATDNDAEPRYRLLESQRAYALEQLATTGELARQQQRHAHAVAALFDAAWSERDRGGVAFGDWQRRLAPDLDNARDAIAWARAAGDSACLLTIAATLLRAMPRALQSERVVLADSCEPLLAAEPSTRLRLRGWLMLGSVWADAFPARSRAATEQAVALASALDGQAHSAYQRYPALYECTYWAAQLGDRPAAERALAELKSADDPGWTPQRRFYLAEAEAVVAELQGDHPDTLRQFRRALSGDTSSVPPGLPVGAVRSVEVARHKLFFARLALGRPALARELAPAGWARAGTPMQRAAWADPLALLLVLESNPRDAARLAGYADVLHETSGSEREADGGVALGRADALARQALGDAEFERLRSEGRALSDAAAAALAGLAAPAPAAGTNAQRPVSRASTRR